MPPFLFRYILRDLVKLLVLSTTVLVVIISFGAAIRPLGDGTLGPLDLLKFILLAMPPMLQFALPFAGAFSATLVYHRLASDNEITACAAAGVPYTQLLLPSATLGLVLTIVLSLLANHISPRFWEAMERTARLDATEYLIRSIQMGEPVKIENSLIYARDAVRLPVEEGSDAYASVWLRGFVAADVRDGEPVWEVAAEQGVIDLTQREHLTVLTAKMQNATFYDADTGVATFHTGIQVPQLAIPEKIRYRPKFMDLDAIREVAAHPERFWRVSARIDELRRWLIQRRLEVAVNRDLQRHGRVVLTSTLPGDATVVRYVIEGARLNVTEPTEWPIQPAPGSRGVRLVRYEQGRPKAEYQVASAVLRPQVNLLPKEPTLELVMREATLRHLDKADEPTVQRGTVTVTGLAWGEPVAAGLYEMSQEQLEDVAREFADDRAIQPLVAAINREVASLQSDILSRMHERAALAVSCVVMMLLGSVLALRLSGRLPLTVYLLSFLPSVIGLVLISAGSDLVESLEVDRRGGLLVMWSGNVVMTLLALATLRRVMRT